ncbi:[FeFe] hydrogenase H-cluster maturation GTPase HydF [Pseudothermotoga thermarum]|uniref:Iron-only hydrogenase maturation protein HydF n=1 Tax=Pseudothermotoga thermarum DSM 5069 TaxID=688269 RepID=F7YUM8_9THEM|nr:[FeFe] hydrogenase H-cluster maturation GTPase HydF [Pseudothermotoga thermarum]AEH50213.1 iron-only hydrogenase maturation protein HydF [Pseudothermotoga thermarum DSM 5069]
MSLNKTPRSERLHIAIFGRRNAGKSSLINAITGQNVALVSPVKGTTTDPVYKAMELLPLGPVVFIDTAGIDDEGELGELRKKKTWEVLGKTDVAILLIDNTEGVGEPEEEILSAIKKQKIPAIAVFNKCDLKTISSDMLSFYNAKWEIPVVQVSAATGEGIEKLKEILMQTAKADEDQVFIVKDLISRGDFVVLVVPIDKSAPKGRLILPQQQTIREIIDAGGMAVVTQEDRLKETLDALKVKPRLVITDSQVFHKVAADTPLDIPLTSFSILFARYKGDLEELVKGTQAVEKLKDGDKVLIAEACTHHRLDDDIAQVKIPRWLKQKTGKNLHIDIASGGDFPENLKEYSLVIHCGACMLNRREMMRRIRQVKEAGVPIVNYGVFIAYVQGILNRVLQPFRKLRNALKEEEETKVV